MTAARVDHRPAGSRSAWSSPHHAATAIGRILVIDDEPRICGFLRRALEHAGYRVDVATGAIDGVRRACGGGYGLVVLDLVMPDLDGRTALAAIMRVQPAQAVLVLSCTTDVGTKVACLDLGARDYLTKPFSLAELIARVRARLRDAAQQNEIMQVGDLTVDAGRLMADRGNGPVALTRLEFLLLRALMEHGGGSATKSELLASVWGIEFDPGSNVVDVCVRRLRAKLGFSLIETVRGEGYRLAP